MNHARLQNGRIGRHRSGGFTLLEILAAFVIFAVAYVTLLQIFGGGVRSTILSQEYTEAILLAQSKIAELGMEEPLGTGGDDGDFDEKYRWELEVTQWESGGSVSSGGYQTELLHVSLTVLWGNGDRENRATLETLRTVSAE